MNNEKFTDNEKFEAIGELHKSCGPFFNRKFITENELMICEILHEAREWNHEWSSYGSLENVKKPMGIEDFSAKLAKKYEVKLKQN